MIRSLLRNFKFMAGFLFVFGVFGASIYYGIFFHDKIPVAPLTFAEGEIPIIPVYSPIEHPPFGTNKVGQDLFFLILVGAKYTIGVALIVTILRFILSAFIGVLVETYFPNRVRKLPPVNDAFRYVPATLICYFILLDAFDFSKLGLSGKVLLEIVILVLVALPVTTKLIADETRHIYNREFIEGAKLMGGSKWHILRKHVRPFLTPQLFIIFARELMQTLLLLAHLGVLSIFVGGGTSTTNWFGDPTIVPNAGEWAGLIAKNFDDIILGTEPWIGLIVLSCFTITILAVRLSIFGMEEVFQLEEKVTKKHRRRKKMNQKPPQKSQPSDGKEFTFVR